MDKAGIFKFISKQKTAFIASVDENGYPVVRAVCAPRKIDGNEIYFSTNTSSKKVRQFLANGKACLYFYKRGKICYNEMEQRILSDVGMTRWGTIKKKKNGFTILPLNSYKMKKIDIDEIYLP